MPITQYHRFANMVSTLVKAACISSVQDSKQLVHWNSINNLQPADHFKARINHEEDFSDMRTLIITEQFTPASFRLAASSSSRPSFINRRKSMWELSPPCEGGFLKHLQKCILLFLGLLLCFSFIFTLYTVDEGMRIAVKGSSPERRLMGFHGNTEKLMGFHGNTEKFYKRHRIEDMGYPSPLHTHVQDSEKAPHLHKEAALHGLGVLFSKGTKPMQNLIIANLEESFDMLDFRLFLRTLYRSGAMAKSDLVLLFPWPSLPRAVSDVLHEEDNSFKKLIAMNLASPPTHSTNASGISVLDALSFERMSSMKIDDAKSTDKKQVYFIWGQNSSAKLETEAHLIYPHYGSVVGFHMNELDSSDGFSAFFINPSSQLRRWLCYQMLLGLLRYKFKRVMLVELGGVVILGDVFSQTKPKDFLYFTLEDFTWTEATIECCHVTQQGERQSLLSGRDMHTDHQLKSLIEASTHDGDTQTLSLRHNGLPGVVERMHDNGHAVHENMLNDDEGAKRRGRMRYVQRTDITVRSKIHEQLHKSTHDQGDDARKHNRKENGVRMTSLLNAKNTKRNTAAKRHTGARMQGHVSAKQSLMEMVYGKEVWESLEQVEKERRVVNSRVILGSMRDAKTLATSMAIEIVRVALQRKSKLSFPDCALVSYLVQKSTNLLGKRVIESLQVMGNRESLVHIVHKSKLEDVFLRPSDGHKYAIVQASSLNMQGPGFIPLYQQRDQSVMSNLTLSHLIRADICACTTNSAVIYHDCGLQQAL